MSGSASFFLLANSGLKMLMKMRCFFGVGVVAAVDEPELELFADDGVVVEVCIAGLCAIEFTDVCTGVGFKNLRGIGGVKDAIGVGFVVVAFCGGVVVVLFVVVTLAASVTRFTL